MFSTMKATIDAAGRLVVPKQIRASLGFKAGQELELEVRDGKLEIDVPFTEMVLRPEGKSLTAIPAQDLPPLSIDDVRETLDRIRR